MLTVSPDSFRTVALPEKDGTFSERGGGAPNGTIIPVVAPQRRLEA